MDRDIPLGRIAGIKVGMNPTVAILAVLYTVLLATNRFPYEQPGLSTGAYWIAGVGGALLLFLSLLVHEIGHALVARDEGIGVHSMALTMLGGVTRMESSPTTAGSELRVSVVGPLASAAWGVALLCGAYMLPNGGALGLTGHVFAWAGLLNLILAAFNLVPASPLDGGKVLSSLIWLKTGNQSLAMKWAARAGVAVGALIVVVGIRDLRQPAGGQYGWWFLLVGGFILVSAWRELQAAPLYDLLEGVSVGEAMIPALPAAADWSSIADFVRSIPRDPSLKAFPVVGNDGRVTGLLTAEAIRAVPQAQWPHLPVSAVAFPTERLVRLRPDEPMLSALQKVESGDVHIGLVIDATGRVCGTLDNRAIHTVVARRRAGLVGAH